MVTAYRSLHQQRVCELVKRQDYHLCRSSVCISFRLSSDQIIPSNTRSTEKDIATVQAADADDIDKAVKAAKAALQADSWKKLPASDRGQLMARLADLVEENRELFATIDAVGSHH